MAVTFLTGFEAQFVPVDGITALYGAAAYNTSLARTGAVSVRCNPGSGTYGYIQKSAWAAYEHFAVYIATLLTIQRSIAGSPGTGGLRLNSAGTIGLYTSGGSLVGTSSTALVTGRWYWIGWRTAAGTGVVCLQIDGGDEITGDVVTPAFVGLGFPGGEASAVDVYLDDWIGDDAGFLASSKVDIALPISDNGAHTGWTGGGGGTTNLYAGVDNTPPAGAATDTDATNIKAIASTGGTYIANLETYTTLGVASGDTVLAVRSVIRHGEDVTTGTKNGTFGAVTNPTISDALAFLFGDNATLHGAEVGNWKTQFGTLTLSPSVTVGTSPTLSITRPNESRVGCVDFMGLLVAWTPASFTAYVRTAADSISSLTDSIARAFVGARAPSDSISSISESVSRQSAKPRTAADNLPTLTETVGSVKGLVRTVADSVSSLTETAVRSAANWVRTGADSIGSLTEDVARAAMAKARTAGDSVTTLTEAPTRLLTAVRTAADSVPTLAEDVARAAMAKARAAADSVSSITEAVVGVVSGGAQAFERTASDALASLTESVSRAGAFARTAGDSLPSLSEVVSRAGVFARTSADSIASLTEGVARAAAAKARTAADSVASLTESPTRLLAAIRTAGDSVATLTETVARAAAAKVRTASDTVSSITEAVVGVVSSVHDYVRTAADSLPTLTEAVSRAGVFTRTGADSLGSLTETVARAAAAKARTAADTIPSLGESAVRGAAAWVRTAADSVSTITESPIAVIIGATIKGLAVAIHSLIHQALSGNAVAPSTAESSLFVHQAVSGNAAAPSSGVASDDSLGDATTGDS